MSDQEPLRSTLHQKLKSRLISSNSIQQINVLNRINMPRSNLIDVDFGPSESRIIGFFGGAEG